MALLSAPDGLCVIATLDALCLRVNWNSLSNATTYSIYRSPIPHDSFALLSSGIPGLTYYDNPSSDETNLNIDNEFYYKVSATNADGEGALSAPSTYRPYGELVHTNIPRPGLSHWNLIGG